MYDLIKSFKGSPNGARPLAGLVSFKTSLYGTTANGGVYGLGSVFEITESGKKRVLYSFKGYPTDGAQPTAGLTVLNGKLYGTTQQGGNASEDGTVFEVDTAGAEHVLYELEPTRKMETTRRQALSPSKGLYMGRHNGAEVPAVFILRDAEPSSKFRPLPEPKASFTASILSKRPTGFSRQQT